MESADFVVIGAGIAGASVAYELAAHARVVVLEREAVAGYHTTGRSAAVFTEAYEKSGIRALTRASRPFLEDPPEGFTDVRLLSPLPVLFVGRDDQLDALEQVLHESVDLVRWVDPIEALTLCPVLRPGYVAGGVLEADARSIDVHALHQGFLRGLRRRGSRVLTKAEVSSLVYTSTWTVGTTQGPIRTPVIVDAAGAWADQVAEMAGARPVGLTPLRRTAFTFDPPPDIGGRAWPMVFDVGEDFYFRLDGPQILASPCDEEPMEPCDVRHEEIDVAIAIDRIQAATTLTIRHVRNAWAGLRTFAPDRTPVVGWDPEVPGFFWLAGQGGFGIMTSPAMARTASALITGGAVQESIDTTLLDPGRF
ncbi:MAG TPA: FAD-binding oxidoreductase [Actinobacteria bacterium]|nr:hydrogen cyanide synthase subunit HcnC precursor [bacterium BMS3Bbin01]HDH26333.1 FAD-binding oxidoreductase [Actinomycetota bacterium]